MKLLAIDTSTDACSAALYFDGTVLSRYQHAPRQHAELILAMIQSMLDDSGIQLKHLDAMAFGRGPGAFTGLRVAAGVTQGIAFAVELPVVPVSTLATLAQQAWSQQEQTNVLAGLDARLGEVYWGQYRLDNGIMRLHGSEQVCRPETVPIPDADSWYGAGSAWAAYPQEFAARLGNRCVAQEADMLPNARYMLDLALSDFRNGYCCSADQAVPVYLRDKVTNTAGPSPVMRT